MIRKFLLFTLGLICVHEICAQQVIGVEYSITEVDKSFSVDKVYHKNTGERLTQREFTKLVKANPKLHLIKEFDQEGNVIRYIYDPKVQGYAKAPRTTEVPIMNQPFPPFKLKSIYQKELNLDDLRGKVIILRFEMEASSFRFKKHEIEELDSKIKLLDEPDLVEAIIIFRTNRNEIIQGFDLKGSRFHLVANGSNLMGKYNIKRFPKTLVIDQEGNLAGDFNWSEDIVLEDYFEE